MDKPKKEFVTCLCGGAMQWNEKKEKYVCTICSNECSVDMVILGNMIDPNIPGAKKGGRKMANEKTDGRVECKTEGCSAEAKTKSGLCNRCYQREWARNNKGKGKKKKTGRKQKGGIVPEDSSVKPTTLSHSESVVPENPKLDSLTDAELESYIVKILGDIKELREGYKKQREELTRVIDYYRRRRLEDGNKKEAV